MKLVGLNISVVAIAASLLLFNCNSNKPNENEPKEVGKDTTKSINDNQNEALVKNKVVTFLNWYKNRYDTLSSIPLITITDDEKGYYEINSNKVEDYLKIFDKSGFFTQEFLDHKKIYFKNCDAKMQKEKQNDGPPIGLEHDLFLLTQDIENAFLEINNVSLTNYQQSENISNIEVHLNNPLKFILKKENNIWLIDDIKLTPSN